MGILKIIVIKNLCVKNIKQKTVESRKKSRDKYANHSEAHTAN